MGGKGKHTRRQKGRYEEQPRATEAAQVLVTKPDLPKARIPVLSALFDNPTQEGDVIPLAPPPPSASNPRLETPSVEDSIRSPLFIALFPIRLRRPRQLLRTRLMENGRKRMSNPAHRHIGRESLSHSRNNTLRTERITSLRNGLQFLSLAKEEYQH